MMIDYKMMLQAPTNGGFRMEDYWVWCGSVIRGEDSRYHMFASRWPKLFPMHPGWVFRSEIVRASSDTPVGPYQFEEIVLPARGAAYWDGQATHNPSIVRYGDKYLLFYTGITYPFDIHADSLNGEDERYLTAQANKRIGVAVASSITGPWTRMDSPILPTRTHFFDSFLTSNPAPCVSEDGSVLLIYKARAYIGNRMGPMTIGAARASRFDGHYRRGDYPIFAKDSRGEMEDPFVWRGEDGKYHMIAKDMTGKICGEKHGGAYAHSSDGKEWTIVNGHKAYSRHVEWDDGTSQEMGSFERPFVLLEQGKPRCIFAATGSGPGGFSNNTHTWNMAVPLR